MSELKLRPPRKRKTKPNSEEKNSSKQVPSRDVIRHAPGSGEAARKTRRGEGSVCHCFGEQVGRLDPTGLAKSEMGE